MMIIGFVGLPGSGKGVASDVARSMGLKMLVMGDIIRREAKRLGLEPSDENLGNVGNMLRAREGPDAVARRTMQYALEANFKEASCRGDIIVIDGLRSRAEADFFRSQADEFHLIEIVAPTDARIKWLISRGRPDDPHPCDSREDYGNSKTAASCKIGSTDTAEALEKRESRELSWGMCEAMSVADLRLENDGDLEEFKSSVSKLLNSLISG